ncbi:hypothetical protein FBY28_0071 [Arthrobacter sp. SLBN-53]|nr:hypothetical protein FBY28_0071 [Arthrobacter sp. SLBN-53]
MNNHAAWSAVVACGAMLAAAGCGSPTVIDTGEPWTPAQTASPTPELPKPRTNNQLADAAAFYVAGPEQKAYHFTTPSGRWQCAIMPHASAGCQPTGGSALSITGAPDEVAGPDGEMTAPNTVLIDRHGDVQFVSADAASYTVVPGPAATLPFGRVLMVAGFRCNVQESTGISCGSETSARGFTFSADGYLPVYTDVATE